MEKNIDMKSSRHPVDFLPNPVQAHFKELDLHLSHISPTIVIPVHANMHANMRACTPWNIIKLHKYACVLPSWCLQLLKV